MQKFTMTKKDMDALILKMSKITGKKICCKYEFVSYYNTVIDGEEQHVTFDSEFSDPTKISNIYQLVFLEEDRNYVRLKLYRNFRKNYKLNRCESLFTLGTYLQCCGVTEREDILNHILLYLEQ